MNRHYKINRSRLPLHEQVPLLTGWYKRRFEASRRVYLPAAWCPGRAQTWFVFPGTDHHPHYSSPIPQLSLIPARNLHRILSESPAQANSTPTGERALDVLRHLARKNAFEPQLVTAIVITPVSTRFTLTKAQIDWLGCRRRTLILSGFGGMANIRSLTSWAKINRPSPIKFEDLMRKLKTTDR